MSMSALFVRLVKRLLVVRKTQGEIICQGKFLINGMVGMMVSFWWLMDYENRCN